MQVLKGMSRRAMGGASREQNSVQRVPAMYFRPSRQLIRRSFHPRAFFKLEHQAPAGLESTKTSEEGSRASTSGAFIWPKLMGVPQCGGIQFSTVVWATLWLKAQKDHPRIASEPL